MSPAEMSTNNETTARQAANSPQPPQFHLGLNTCFAVKRWADPNHWAERVAALGLVDVQFSVDLLPLGMDDVALCDYVRRLRTAIDVHGLRLHSWFTGLAAYGSNLLLSDDKTDRDAAEKWYTRMVDLAAESGARGFGGHLGALSVPSAAKPVVARELVSWEVDAMHRLADRAREVGLDHLQFENLAVTREFGHSIAEAHELERRLTGSAVPWRLCLDLGHPVGLPPSSKSTDPVAWLSETWANIPIVQLQQSPIGADHHGAFTARNNATGAVNRDACLKALRSQYSDAEVYLFFEIIHPHEYDDALVLEEIKESIAFWDEALS